MELILICIAAMALGVLIGLLPSLPVFLGPLLMLPFAQHISTEAMLLVWMLTIIGSQYFGSVAVITTKIPGEENTLIYLRDLDNLTLMEKVGLLRHTALGSLIAGLLSAAILYMAFYVLKIKDSNLFSMAWMQALVFSTLLLSFIIMEFRKWWAAVALMAVGLVLSTKNNYALPSWWITVQSMFDDKTLFMMTLGLVIIPGALDRFDLSESITSIKEHTQMKFPWVSAIVASIVGFIAGLVPGPSAYTGSYAAYQISRDPKIKIIAAEAANNSAVIASALPFLLTAIPLNQNTLLLLAALELNGVEINHAIWGTGSLGMTLMGEILLAIVASSVIYYFLAVNFIRYYVKVIELFHKRGLILLTSLLLLMCAVDINTSNVDTLSYIALTGFFTVVGLGLRKLKINSLPFLFAIIIGDRLVWSFIQVYRIYF
jgi:putative tricarboxylic transport membrane protein